MCNISNNYSPEEIFKLKKENTDLKKALSEIIGVGFTTEFSGAVDFSSTNHEKCREIAIKTLLNNNRD